MDGDQLQALINMISNTVADNLRHQMGARGGGSDGHGGGGEGGRGGKIRLNSKGWDNLESFGGGEERWTTWSWKVKVATGAMAPKIRTFMERPRITKARSYETWMI